MGRARVGFSFCQHTGFFFCVTRHVQPTQGSGALRFLPVRNRATRTKFVEHSQIVILKNNNSIQKPGRLCEHNEHHKLLWRQAERDGGGGGILQIKKLSFGLSRVGIA